MAIVKRIRKNKVTYQVKIKGTDGMWITVTCNSKAQAETKEAELKAQKGSGLVVRNIGNQLTVAQYFPSWDSETRNGNISHSWRLDQVRDFERFVEPVIGKVKMQAVTPAHISRVLARMVTLKKAPQTRLHVYNLMHKMFGDAIELFQILQRNPVLKTLKPELVQRETPYLEVGEAKTLLQHVKDKPFGIAVWLGIYVGLRVGEIQALQYGHLDLETGEILLQHTYVRKEDKIQEYPKGKKWHRIPMPLELRAMIAREQRKGLSKFVATSPKGEFLSYHSYHKALKRFCREAGVRAVTSHGLRHSTSEVYMEHGAGHAEIRKLFAHSSSKVTDRYIHDKGTRLEKVANTIQLFSSESGCESGVSPKFPQTGETGICGEK